MKGSRFSEEQIIGVLREHEAGAKTEEVCRRHGISSATLYKWKSKYGGLEVSAARRLKALEDENRRLKKLLAESMLDNAALDFVSDTLADGRRFRVLCVVDDFSRECLAAVVDTSLGDSHGTTSSPANQCRMLSSNHSTASCAMSASTSMYSKVSPQRGNPSKHGATTTTTCDRLAVSEP